MRASHWIRPFIVFSLSVLFVSSASAQTPVARISGDVVRVDGQNLELQSKLSPGDGAFTMTLTYAGGENTVVVPHGTPIMKTETADRSALVPGAHVLAYAVKQPDGTLLSDRVSIGKDGYTPAA